MLICLFACAAPDPITVPATEPEPTVTEPTAPSVDLLSEALEGRCPAVEGSAGDPGEDLRRVTLTGAEAVCNDGTPPVLYVRAATDPAHLRDWVVYVDGGSHCYDHETCAVRWCGEEFYDASKMSTKWARGSIAAPGLQSPEDWNRFAGWNQARLHYCSSDFWIGTKADHVFEGDPAYRLHFEGHDILLAGLDALEAGVTSDDAAETLPSLTDAATVVFSGSSAGAFGAGQHLGEVVGRLPAARVIGVIDSFLPPPHEDMTPAESAAHDGSVQAVWDDIVTPIWAGVVDETCVAANPETWRCSNLDLVLRESVTVELAVHQDLFDPVLYPTYQAIGMSQVRLAELWTAGLRRYADTVPGVAVHGSRCPHHTVLSETGWYDRLTVADDLGERWSVHAMLAAQLDGVRAAAVDDLDGAQTTCP